MIRLPARPLSSFGARAAAALVLCPLALCAPFTAHAQQQPPGGFRLPEPTPSPTPAPAGPADERAGVAIPPRSVPAPRITPTPAPRPTPAVTAAPTAIPSPRPITLPTPRASDTATTARPQRAPTPAPAVVPDAAPDAAGPAGTIPAEPAQPADPLTLPPAPAVPLPDSSATVSTPSDAPAPAPAPADDLSAWWPWAAGGAGALALLGGGLMLLRRRKPEEPHLAAPSVSAAGDAAPPAVLPRLDLALQITGATRSVMMFTLRYRLTIANRSERAVNDLALGVQLACARANSGAGADNAPTPRAAQALAQVERIGPHQARAITGEVQLPLSAIAPLRQGSVPLFVPLVHITVEGDGQRTLARSFVVGTPSAGGAGRVHPIPLDQPPGAINGLVAQGVAIPAISAAA